MVGPFIATPLFGTRLYEIAKTNNYLIREISPKNLNEATQFYGKGLIKTNEFTPEDLKNLARRAVQIFILIDVTKHPTKYLSIGIKNPKVALRYIRNLI
jgi:hypothetical protein